jgi:hypothetical protein
VKNQDVATLHITSAIASQRKYAYLAVPAAVPVDAETVPAEN